MVWKTLAIACIAMAFTTLAQAECGGDHGKTASVENQVAADAQPATGGLTEQASAEQAPK